jgi:putative glutamine amidotransferase
LGEISVKVFIVGGNYQYEDMFTKRGWEVVSEPHLADLVQFTGGEDVSPEMYGEERHQHTYCNPRRDSAESALYAWCIQTNTPMAGICRGGQFLNVMNGGKMYQHVENHAIYGTHKVWDCELEKYFECTSTHHQMMIHHPEKGDIIGIANEGGIKQTMLGKQVVVVQPTELNIDLEVVHYKDTKSLCFQPHPEFPGYKECTDYYFLCLQRELGLGEGNGV